MKTYNFIIALLVVLSLQMESFGQIKTVDDLTKFTYGSHSVGFKFLTLFDYSRQGILEQKDQSKRIVPIYFWYPTNSKNSKNSQTTLKTYLNYIGKETDYDISLDSLYNESLYNLGRSSFWLTDLSNFKKLHHTNLITKSIENAKIKKDKFPLIILNHGPIIYWHFMAEFLASHGFIVAYSPSAGTYDKRLEEGMTSIQTQLRDIEFMIGHLSNIPEVNIKNIGAIGFSMGSLATMELASKNNAVNAVVSLDGIIGDSNEGELLYEMPYFDNHKYSSSLLHMTGGLSNDFNKIKKLQFSDRYTLEMKGMRHGDFSGQGLYDKLNIQIAGPNEGDYQEGFQLVSNYVLLFLNAKLKKQASHFENLFDGVVEHPMLIGENIYNKSKKNYKYAQLVKLVFEGDYKTLFKIYDDHKDIEIKAFSYATFHDIGMHLYFRAQYKEALQWFQYFAKSYPNSSKAYYQICNSMRRLKDFKSAYIALLKAEKLVDDDPYLSKGQIDLYKDRISRIKRTLEEDLKQ